MHGDLERIKRFLENTARLLANKISAATADNDAKADFLDGAIHHAPFADRLENAVRKDPALADLTNEKGQRAIDLACYECRRAMQRALFFLGRYDVDKTPALHFSTTTAVLGATAVFQGSDAFWNPHEAVGLRVCSVQNAGAGLQGAARMQ